MYVVLRKTPPYLSAYKFHFLHLNGCYQVAVIFIALFGPFEVTIEDDGLIILEHRGVIQYLPHKWLYLELFFVSFFIFSMISAVFLSFLLRYCQVCHPNSRYTTTPLIRKGVEAVLTTVIPLPLAVFFTVAIIIHSQVILGYVANLKTCVSDVRIIQI
uniref:G_PROTEIN_RECEP_F1_2 domain-containing protein n=1 Tax=Steinernema glaseri TaxID=37863 RepID=A0A1I7YFA7_9BILA